MTVEIGSSAIVDVLNRIHEADPTVLPKLIDYRVPCNGTLADDPTVQVGRLEDEVGWEVGILGILNGIGGIDSSGSGYVAAIYDDEGKLTHFTVLEFEGNEG